MGQAPFSISWGPGCLLLQQQKPQQLLLREPWHSEAGTECSVAPGLFSHFLGAVLAGVLTILQAAAIQEDSRSSLSFPPQGLQQVKLGGRSAHLSPALFHASLRAFPSEYSVTPFSVSELKSGIACGPIVPTKHGLAICEQSSLTY